MLQTNQSKKSIFVVEDNRHLNRLYVKQLKSRGFSVTSMSTIAEARELLDNAPPPSIMMLDLELEDGSGTEILEILNQKNFNDTKTIVVSGKPFSHQHGLHNYHVDHTLLKPVSLRGLAALVDSLVAPALV